MHDLVKYLRRLLRKCTSVTVLEASPVNSSGISTPHLDVDPVTAANLAEPSAEAAALKESVDGKPGEKNSNADNDMDVDGVSLDLEGDGKGREGQIVEEEQGDKDDEGGGEDEEHKAEDEAVNPAIIYKPPQLIKPPQIVTAARPPELYGAPPAISNSVQAPPSSSLQAQPTVVAAGYIPAQPTVVAAGYIPAQDPSSEGQGPSETAEEADKQARKKKKEKKLATGPSLMMKKKHMSSMVQKWQKVKKEVEKEDRAKEMRQAAIRKKIEELK
ncbi:hypothetical protein ElyMa_003445100 [Elysia marginata]|uniref:Uncharacterized protein n=1 Tax=Elysia marginata TaxID=1093978 RepID=A0AAV4JV33_9GAST|nr:hypothetical protein ElyMa_003445100 [Elysia marginata]